MKVIAVLPFGKVDPGISKPQVPLDLTTLGADATKAETLGYDSLWLSENKKDPFVSAALAAQATDRLHISNSVVIAFARSPAVSAMYAWSMQELSKGRFSLGLGSQVRAHIQRRFGVSDWTPAGTWMREYVQAVRAYWDCWQYDKPLNFAGERYKLDLMVPQFNPGPLQDPHIPIHLAALNPYMSQVAGEVADSIGPHPICTRSYIEQVMSPALAKGATRAGRDPKAIAVAMRSLIATGPNEESLAPRIEATRGRVSFYASTPSYRPVFEHHGLGDLARQLSVLAREKRWQEMPALISDDILRTFAVIGTFDEIIERMRERCAGLADSTEFSIPVTSEDEFEQLADFIRQLKAL
ncbi:MAG: putative F420-dependent oxidoreductase [Gammaproteobacteria bacterium]|jgi:probable F420-dependent oxidoreductase